MKHQIELKGQKIEFTVKKNRHARQIRVMVFPNGRITVSAPRFVSLKYIKKFLASKDKWITDTLKNCRPDDPMKKIGARAEYLKNKKMAEQITRAKIAQFNEIYNFRFNKIYIRNQSTRWGSCSRNGNLSFNFRLVFLPEPLLDYLIVHELCHLGEMNHSHRFWALVEKTIHNYKKRKAALRVMGRELL